MAIQFENCLVLEASDELTSARTEVEQRKSSRCLWIRPPGPWCCRKNINSWVSFGIPIYHTCTRGHKIPQFQECSHLRKSISKGVLAACLQDEGDDGAAARAGLHPEEVLPNTMEMMKIRTSSIFEFEMIVLCCFDIPLFRFWGSKGFGAPFLTQRQVSGPWTIIVDEFRTCFEDSVDRLPKQVCVDKGDCRIEYFVTIESVCLSP